MSDDENASVSSAGKDSSASDARATSRRPVFFRYPMGWSDWSEEEKDRFLDEVAAAIMERAQD
jgi:hypothetical protein